MNNDLMLGGLAKIGTAASDTMAPYIDENITAPLTGGKWGVRPEGEPLPVTPLSGVDTKIGGVPKSSFAVSGGGSSGESGPVAIEGDADDYELEGAEEERPFYFKVDPGLVTAIAKALASGEIRANIIQ
jgi:hypothetical protein